MSDENTHLMIEACVAQVPDPLERLSQMALRYADNCSSPENARAVVEHAVAELRERLAATPGLSP